MLTRPSTALLAAAVLAGGVWTLAQTKPADPPAAKPAAAAAKPAPKPAPPKPGVPSKGPGVRFLHEHHSGPVPVPGKKGVTRDLSCANCHAASVAQPDTNKYPGPDLIKFPETVKLAMTGSKVNKLGFPKSHSACTECHSEIAPGSQKMCGMCHESIAKLRVFPNPDVELSQFADRYSHKAHKDYFDGNPEPSKVTASHRLTDASFLPVRLAAPVAAVEKGLRCLECHVPEAKGSKMQLPQHEGCFVCHAKTKIVPEKSDTFWNKCSGCHANMEANKPTIDPALKAPKDATHAVAAMVLPIRYVVTPTGPRNPAFMHSSHATMTPDTGKSAGKALEGKTSCLFCHTSAERASVRDQMTAFAIKKTDPQLTQPPATACTVCHVHAKQMVIAAPGKTTQCLVCHTKQDAAKPVPANHLPPADAKPAEAPATAKPAAADPKPATPEAKPPATEPAPQPKPPSVSLREMRLVP